MIDIQRLAILREIERTGSLIAAADRLNLTQSAVCHAIRRFEQRQALGVAHAAALTDGRISAWVGHAGLAAT